MRSVAAVVFGCLLATGLLGACLTEDGDPPPEVDQVSSPLLVDGCDADHDGYLAVSCGGRDCNDHDATIHPGHESACADGLDNDCDGATDDDDRDCDDGGCLNCIGW